MIQNKGIFFNKTQGQKTIGNNYSFKMKRKTRLGANTNDKKNHDLFCNLQCMCQYLIWHFINQQKQTRWIFFWIKTAEWSELQRFPACSPTRSVCVYASKETHIHFRYMNPIIKISHLVDGARTVGEFMDAPWWWWRQRPCPYPEFVSFNGPLESNQIFSLIRPRLLSPSFSSSSFWCFLWPVDI